MLRPQRPYGLIGTGAQDVHLDFHTTSEAPFDRFKFNFALRSQSPTRTVRDGEPRMSTSTFTQLLSSEVPLHCCVTSTGTTRTVRDRKPRMSTSSFTQLLCSLCLGRLKSQSCLHQGTCLLFTTAPPRASYFKNTHTRISLFFRFCCCCCCCFGGGGGGRRVWGVYRGRRGVASGRDA